MSYKNLIALINDTSLALLQGKEGEGNLLLSQFFDELLLLTLKLSPEKMAELSQIMEIMHQAQQNRDYVYLVDILNYALPNLIGLSYLRKTK